MLPSELFDINKLKLVFQTPIAVLLLKTFVISSVLYYIFKFIYSKKLLAGLAILIFLGIFTYYFGILPTLQVFLLLVGSVTFGVKILKFENSFIALITGFLVLMEIYILIALVANFGIALAIINTISVLSILFRFKNNNNLLGLIGSDIRKFIRDINVIDIWILTLSFVLGSLPQSHWDAVNANLYNAKWYILQNSLLPLKESISTLFPQNAVLYYSLFYQIGRIKLLQIAYILPLVVLLGIIKDISTRLKLTGALRLIWYIFIFTPIVVFQSSNGYYDLLIVVVLVTAVYILIFQVNKTKELNILTASFLIGFISAVKYFPLIFLGLPLFIFCLNYKKAKIKAKLLLILLAVLILELTPSVIWMIRSYSYTGNPIYPFFQSLFNDNSWAGGELINNFMIQTTVSAKEWLAGGFLMYPLLTYFKTGSFIEATMGYTGVAHIFLIPLMVVVLILSIKSFLSKKGKSINLICIYSFVAYLIVGLVTRYYRYIWPFQFVLAIVVVVYLLKKIKLTKVNGIIFRGLVFFILMLNVNDLLRYYRFFPVIPERFFKPDYYETHYFEDGPILFLNAIQKRKNSITILDVSQDILPRFNFTPRVYQCSWYWINGTDRVKMYTEERGTLVNDFDYIITSDPPENAYNYCIPSLISDIQRLKLVYSDRLYRIYGTK